MTDINHDLLAKKTQIFDELNDKIEKIRKIKADLVKTHYKFKTELSQALSDTTKSKECINKLENIISKLDTKIKEKDFMYNELCDKSQDMYIDINEIKSALNIKSDYEDDAPTLFGYKVRGMEEFCNDPDIINKLIRILDPAVLERIMKEFCNDPYIINKLMRILDPAVLERIMQDN
uniref:Uncharacterized protein n=1 Tax=viral metagenome TaxID=1070528 RepID=A0A6C0HXR4_9ZZZZ